MHISISEMSDCSFSLNIFSAIHLQFALSAGRDAFLPPPHGTLVAFYIYTVIGKWSLYFSRRPIGTFTLPIIASQRRTKSRLLVPWTDLQVYSVRIEIFHPSLFAHASSRAPRSLVVLSHLLCREFMPPIITACLLDHATMSFSISAPFLLSLQGIATRR